MNRNSLAHPLYYRTTEPWYCGVKCCSTSAMGNRVIIYTLGSEYFGRDVVDVGMIRTKNEYDRIPIGFQ